MLVGGNRGAGTDSVCKAAVTTLKNYGWSTVRIDVGTFHTLPVTNCDVCAQVDVRWEMSSPPCRCCPQSIDKSALPSSINREALRMADSEAFLVNGSKGVVILQGHNALSQHYLKTIAGTSSS